MRIEDEPTQPEYRDHRYSMWDEMAMEVEVAQLVGAWVRATRPQVGVELGAWRGHLATIVGQALKANGEGRCWAIEWEQDRAFEAWGRVGDNELGFIVEVVCADANEWEPLTDFIDLLIVDTDIEGRAKLLERYHPWLRPGGWVATHDTRVAPQVREEMNRVGWVNWVELETPRGLMIGEVMG